MAIAFDAKSSGIQNTGGTTATVAHTCTGANRLLLVGYTQDGAPTVDSATYNGVSMTKLDQVVAADGNDIGLFYLIAPSTGTNNIVVTRSAGTNTLEVMAVSYTGVSQTGFPDATTKGTARNSTTITTVAANAWIAAMVNGNSGTLANGTNLVLRQAGPDANRGMMDSNAAIVTPGSTSVSWSATGTTNEGDVIVSFAPSASGPANVKTVNGLAIASVKTINGLAIGSVKTVNGLA